ncbi:class I SAM-dependent methyltransferase [Corynebacterium lujinxingii]|uniref:Methyltransferase n=1 Tax=Corynebacterium lujinxingii TaxID=2763010 RepID=A0A7H0JWX1_9CORY|nr:methyltransferase [Corynebacterium lujinxingii]MBC3178044.1 methyltransferase [Corynebacterium lujinxingii]NNO09714.1 methyltransferase [Corynebacterium lujinxingii]QNP89537.1 methyltransferase [Corynebacterium lujinxingii]
MRTLDSLIWDIADIQAGEAVIICNDPTLDLTRAALSSGAEVVFADPDHTRCQEARALGAEVVGDVRIDDYFSGASGTAVAIGEMPKSLARLDYLARSIASAGFSQDRVVLGANNKHLSRGMNAVLGESFQDVAASLGRGKFRCLVASGARDVTYEPVRGDGLVAIGGVFSGAKPDRGGELLRSCLPDEPGRLLDLGCGNGSVTRGMSAAATDSDADAVLSARAIGIDATWDDAGSRFADASFDTIALNPPFHDGTAVDATLVQHLLDAAVRLLAPSGALYLVHNSHLRYRSEVERRFAKVEQVTRDKTFTVLRAIP